MEKILDWIIGISIITCVIAFLLFGENEVYIISSIIAMIAGIVYYFKYCPKIKIEDDSDELV